MDNMTLTLTGKEMDIVANALGMRPYVEVAQLLQNISQQIQAQQQPQQLVDPAGRPSMEAPAKVNGAAQQEAPA